MNIRWFTALFSLYTDMAMASPNRDFASRHIDRPVVIAHRGASALAPENTVAAIRLAANLGAAAVEFDVHRSADGVPVVIHDVGLARTTNGRGLVRNQSLEEIQKLSAGAWFSETFRDERIPSLSQALEASGSQMLICIEIKTGLPIMGKVFESVQAADLIDRVVVFSFKPKQIEESKRLRPDVPALLLVDPGVERRYNGDSILEKAREVGADLIGLDHGAASASLVTSLQAQGFPVFVYTVDDPRDLKRVVTFGVDGVISNRPRATLSRSYSLRPRLK